MVDILTKRQRSYNMSRISGKNTSLEIKLKKFLHMNKVKGYRTGVKLTGKPDLVFKKEKLAIFVDGCFWHKCPKCYVVPTTNRNFWKLKIEGNVKRDKLVSRLLKKQGWKVIRFWEHSIKKDIKSCLNRILAVKEG